jgi:hypothetical protein
MADNFGNRLAKARTLVDGLSARELDRLSGTTEGHAGSVEAGTYSPTTPIAARWATSLGVSLDWLVMGHGDAPIAATVAAAVDKARQAWTRAQRKAERAAKRSKTPRARRAAG